MVRRSLVAQLEWAGRAPRTLAIALAFACASFVGTPSARAEPNEANGTAWLCKGCLFDAKEAADAGTIPLFVALHGDGGGEKKLHRALLPAVKRAGGALLSIQCPLDRGCRARSFWQWYSTSGHDEAWLGAQIDAVGERVAIDRARVYAVGYSGGATYLGWYAPSHPTRFAAVAHIAGGMPWGTPCPRCKYPVLFAIGPADPMVVPYTDPLRRYYERCGEHEVTWQPWFGVTHEGIVDTLAAGRSHAIIAWLLAHPARCASDVVDAGAIDASVIDAGDVDASVIDAGVIDASDVGSRNGGSAIPAPKADRGCACATSGGDRSTAAALGTLVLAIAIAFIRRLSSSDYTPWDNSRSRRSRGRTCRPRGSLGASTGSDTCTGLGSGS